MELLQELFLALLLGVIISLITLIPLIIPPLRKFGRENGAIRIGKSLIFGLIGFISFVLILSWLWAYATYAFDVIEGSCLDCVNVAERHESALKSEYFRRYLLYPFHPDCFSDNAEVCQIADPNVEESLSQSSYVIMIYAGLFAAGLNFYVTYRLTRVRQVSVDEPVI